MEKLGKLIGSTSVGQDTIHVGKYKKQITGRINITLSIPCMFNVNAEDVEYEDEHGKPYYETEWEYSPDEIIEQVAIAKKIQNEYAMMVSEISIEEC